MSICPYYPIIIPVAGVRLVLACIHSDLGLTSAESASRVLDLQENLQSSVITLTTYSQKLTLTISCLCLFSHNLKIDHSVNILGTDMTQNLDVTAIRIFVSVDCRVESRPNPNSIL